MNIIVFTTWTGDNFLPAVHAEIITTHVEKGDQVKVVVCDSQLHSCFIPHLFQADKDNPPFKDKQTCINCQLKWRSILQNNIGIPKENIVSLASFPKDITIPFFTTKKEVEQHKFQNINIGLGIMSSLISIYRDVDIDIHQKRKVVEAIYKNVVSTVLTMENLKGFEPDKVYIYNGRVAERRAVVEFCEVNKIDYDTWEVAQSLQHYFLVNKTLPHNPKVLAQTAKRLFYEDKSVSQESKIEFAQNWYQTKRYGNYEDNPSDINYTKLMKETNIDSLNVDKNRTNVAIFVSSEDEIASLGEKIWPFKYRQTETITQIIEHFDKKENNNFHFYLRIHPNLRNLVNKETEKLKNLKGNCLTIIPANSPLSSYTLLDTCDKVVCFGSTIGIEATFWQKTSILFGTAMYKYIENSINIAESISHLMELIEDENLSPKNKEAALVYAYGLFHRGTRIKKLDIYEQPVEKLYNKNKLLYPIYKLYKKSSIVGKTVRFFNIEKIAKNMLIFFYKN